MMDIIFTQGVGACGKKIWIILSRNAHEAR
jgi:hypothetical protein